MRIVIAASEAAPFCKTGGLGDVLQALPGELSKLPNNEVTLFLPYYKRMKDNAELETELVTTFQISLSWRQQHVGLFRLKSRKKKLRVYFIDNEYYFYRDGLYGFFDDGERYAYFAKAVLSCVSFLELNPEIIHCHDWQTAMIPVYLNAEFRGSLPAAKSVFTIHNVEYQGKAGNDFFADTLGLDEYWRGVCTFDGCINMMKAAIVTADLVTTVSETYAQELRYPYYAHGLSGILAGKGDNLKGITNGIDTEVYNPRTDKALVKNFTADSFGDKLENKRALQKELGLWENDAPILAMVTRLAGHKGIDLLCYIIRRLLQRELELVIVGTGEASYERVLQQIAYEFPGKMSMNLKFDPALASRVYAGADMYLMPSKSEPCGLSQLIAMHYGTVPIVNATGGLKDTVWSYDPYSGAGRGFTFQSYNGDDFLGAIDRALTEYYDNPEAWKRLAQNDMRIDFGWKQPAEKYQALYESLVN